MRGFSWGPVGQAVKFSKGVALKCHQILTLLRNSLATCWEVPELRLLVLLRMNLRFALFQEKYLKHAIFFHIQKFFLLNNKGNLQEMRVRKGNRKEEGGSRGVGCITNCQVLIRNHSLSTPLLR